MPSHSTAPAKKSQKKSTSKSKSLIAPASVVRPLTVSKFTTQAVIYHAYAGYGTRIRHTAVVAVQNLIQNHATRVFYLALYFCRAAGRKTLSEADVVAALKAEGNPFLVELPVGNNQPYVKPQGYDTLRQAIKALEPALTAH
jgi:histone H3/H4